MIPGLTQWVKYPALLGLWYRMAASALVQPLTWELPYATHMALKQTNKHTKNQEVNAKAEFQTAWLGIEKVS